MGSPQALTTVQVYPGGSVTVSARDVGTPLNPRRALSDLAHALWRRLLPPRKETIVAPRTPSSTVRRDSRSEATSSNMRPERRCRISRFRVMRCSQEPLIKRAHLGLASCSRVGHFRTG